MTPLPIPLTQAFQCLDGCLAGTGLQPAAVVGTMEGLPQWCTLARNPLILRLYSNLPTLGDLVTSVAMDGPHATSLHSLVATYLGSWAACVAATRSTASHRGIMAMVVNAVCGHVASELVRLGRWALPADCSVSEDDDVPQFWATIQESALDILCGSEVAVKEMGGLFGKLPLLERHDRDPLRYAESEWSTYLTALYHALVSRDTPPTLLVLEDGHLSFTHSLFLDFSLAQYIVAASTGSDVRGRWTPLLAATPSSFLVQSGSQALEMVASCGSATRVLDALQTVTDSRVRADLKVNAANIIQRLQAASSPSSGAEDLDGVPSLQTPSVSGVPSPHQ
jgi:hypothetical protein